VLLETHTTLEEEIFYPAFRDASPAKDDQTMYYEALEEHNAAKLVLADLERADPATPSFGGKAKVLKELVLHHAKEEERDMFPAARKHLSKKELVDLGSRMAVRRRQSVAKAAE
jgi:hemerythrin-like domain-containing protein